MRLSIDHHTVYRFSEAQARIVQLLRITPVDYLAQTVIDWRIDVDCDARLRTGHDGFGNATTMLYVDGPVDRIAITVRGEVLTEDTGGIIGGLAEPLPPIFYTRETPATRIDDAARALARCCGGSDPLERAHALTALIGGTVRIRAARETAARTAAAIVDSGHATAREAASLLVTVARAAGFPARIVSGHALNGPGRGVRRSAHAWAELHLDPRGWIALDPSTGTGTDESYVRVAVGLDASDVAPVSGTRRGGGIEELDVDVRVDRAEAVEDAQ